MEKSLKSDTKIDLEDKKYAQSPKIEMLRFDDNKN